MNPSWLLAVVYLTFWIGSMGEEFVVDQSPIGIPYISNIL